MNMRQKHCGDKTTLVTLFEGSATQTIVCVQIGLTVCVSDDR